MKTRDQVKTPPNPTGKGGFQERPQDRNKGTWDSTQSISFQYNKLMRLSPKELEIYQPETVAQQIAKTRLQASVDKKFGLPDSKEITDRTEGKAPQSIDVTTGGDKLNVSLVEFVDGNKKDQSTDTN